MPVLGTGDPRVDLRMAGTRAEPIHCSGLLTDVDEPKTGTQGNPAICPT
jgi:hypothetical protein